LAVAEKLSNERVCVRTGWAGMFRDSHVVAFLWKVMVVRDALVVTHYRIPLFASCAVRDHEYQNPSSTG
jgi:hypothetical protein